MNILVNPLRAFAKEEIDYAKLEPDVRHLHMPEIRRYLRSDCVNLWETIKRYFDEYGRSLTQAGAAMRYWKRVYQVPYVPQNAEQAEASRAYYYGGRVECFATGHAVFPVKVIDINSAYPKAMTQKHPIDPKPAISSKLCADRHLPQAMVTLECVSKGAFPVRSGDDFSLSFPNDGVLREYSVTGWEFIQAQELGLVSQLRVIECRRHKQLVDFADYVDHFWRKRKDAKAAGDVAADVFAKLFLNSLYGKWAANPVNYSEFVIASDDGYAGWLAKGYVEIGAWGERVLMGRPLPEVKHTYYNVATAASITGYVRATLLEALTRCTGVLYCDTDSIIARDVGALALGDGLGEWKLELEATEWAIAGKKTYALRGLDGQWKVRSKGARLTAEQLIRVAKGETVTYSPMVPTYSFREKLDTNGNYSPEFIKRKIRRTKSDLHLSV